jgi:hypothetical protein
MSGGAKDNDWYPHEKAMQTTMRQTRRIMCLTECVYKARKFSDVFIKQRRPKIASNQQELGGSKEQVLP